MVQNIIILLQEYNRNLFDYKIYSCQIYLMILKKLRVKKSIFRGSYHLKEIQKEL